MKTVIVYPVPAESAEVWQIFKPFVQRFADSLRKFPPGCEYELCVVINDPDADDEWFDPEVVAMFDRLPATMMLYRGAGCDIGTFQSCSEIFKENVFQVNCVTRVYAHRAGWLNHLVEARRNNGPGLYGTSVSREGGHLHSCCRCYAFDSDDFKRYPCRIDSRDQGVFFELGDGCLLDWFVSQNLAARVVYWDGVYLINENGHWMQPNTYRDGNQENALVWDKHTDAYRDADETEKRRLEEMCFGIDQTPVKA